MTSCQLPVPSGVTPETSFKVGGYMQNLAKKNIVHRTTRSPTHTGGVWDSLRLDPELQDLAELIPGPTMPRKIKGQLVLIELHILGRDQALP